MVIYPPIQQIHQLGNVIMNQVANIQATRMIGVSHSH